MSFPQESELNSPTKHSRKYISIHWPEFEAYLLNNFSFCDRWDAMLYCYYHSIHSLPVCKVCGKPVKFHPKQGFSTYCCCKCAGKDKERLSQISTSIKENYQKQSDIILARRRATMNKRYGVDNYTNADKARQTMIERYGVDNPSKIPGHSDKVRATISAYTEEHRQEIVDKCRKTKLERYGDERYNNKNKIYHTKLERYGDGSYTNKEKATQTMIELYGVSYPGESEELREKSKKTKKERYENEYYTNQEKMRITNKMLYGVEYPLQSREVQLKMQKTCKKRYGNEHYVNTPKTSETCQAKYGVPFACLRPECQAANSNDSKPNNTFASLLDQHGISYEREFTLGRYSYDFKVGDTLIEINPFATHNSTWGLFGKPKNRNYHRDKTNYALDNDYQCICVWDWDDVNKILNLLEHKQSIYARNCDIRKIDSKEANSFLESYHIQGPCKGQTICIGLFYQDELVGLMTFGKPRYNHKYQYELLRLCYRTGYSVLGGSKKMISYFFKNYNPTSIISYCDRSKFSGRVYESIGFELKKVNTPSKHWFHPKLHQHITNNLLLQRGYDQLFGTSYGVGTSNEQLMVDAGFVEIYDCGQATYTYTKKEES